MRDALPHKVMCWRMIAVLRAIYSIGTHQTQASANGLASAGEYGARCRTADLQLPGGGRPRWRPAGREPPASEHGSVWNGGLGMGNRSATVARGGAPGPGWRQPRGSSSTALRGPAYGHQ